MLFGKPKEYHPFSLLNISKKSSRLFTKNFNFPVINSSLSIRLRIICKCCPMPYSIFSQEAIKQIIAKICPFISYNCSWSFKPCEDILSKEIQHHFSITCCSGDIFNPPGHIINAQKTIFVVE